MMIASPEIRMASYLKLIATGPQKSKDLTLEQARDGMSLILKKEVHDVQAGVFLVALRMKRETDDENRGVLEALREATLSAIAPIPELAEIADPYDGFKRHIPTSPFLLPLLAVCGLPTISHGCNRVGPKYGVTHRQIFKAAGVRVDLSPQEAAERLADPAIAWAYIDQSIFCPPLHDLIPLRQLIVKRPAIATLEKLCGPVRSEGKNHIFIGYVHPGYEQQIPMAARHAGYSTCLTVRGVEGGVLLPMHKANEGILYRDGGGNVPIMLDPHEAGINTLLRSIPIPDDFKTVLRAGEEGNPALALASVRTGIEGLSGVRGPARDALVFTASAFLYAVGRFSSLHDATKRVLKEIDSGAALEQFERGRT